MDPQYAKRLGGSKRPQEDPRDPSSAPAASAATAAAAAAAADTGTAHSRSAQAQLGSSPKRRFRSSSKSPQKDAYSDRYIPCRNAGGPAFYGHPGTESPATAGHAAATAAGSDARDEPGKVTYNLLLRNELLGAGVDDMKAHFAENEKKPSGSNTGGVAVQSSPARNVLKYKLTAGRSSAAGGGLFEPQSPYSLTPVSADSQKLLLSPRKAPRKISKVPFKVLDAPDLQDDFYLNLVDWSSQNVLCVGLGSCVYLWSACTSQVTKLCDLRSNGEDDIVTSVKWMQRGSHLAVGTNKGFVQIWDAHKCTNVRTLEGHSGRVGALAWNGNTLSSGSRDRKILQRDIRDTETSYAELLAHKQEVCGLEWSPDDQHLASGGNDNKLFIWNAGYTQPRHRFNEHIAAVKAIAWSPHQHGLLASGGGTADQCIRFWNTLTSTPLQCVETKSQVCNLAWSKNANELVSTHGYSQNQIILWKYPSMTQIATLTGHTYRVLYLAMSPDGQTIVTGAGDETLRFWNVFSKSRSPKQTHSMLNMFTHIR